MIILTCGACGLWVLCIYTCVHAHTHLRAVSIGCILLCEWVLILFSYERRGALVGGDWARRERRLRGAKKAGNLSFSCPEKAVLTLQWGMSMKVAEKAIWGQTQVFQDAPGVLSADQYTWGIKPRRERLLLSLNVLLILLEAVGKLRWNSIFFLWLRTSLAYTLHTRKPGQRWRSV